MLPDAARWLRGVEKRGLIQRDHACMVKFVMETRRAELAHWDMLGCFPIFFLWNPPWATLVMARYAVAANIPCILTQRYNRLNVERALRLPIRRVE